MVDLITLFASWSAKKGFEAGWKLLKKKRVLRNAIDATVGEFVPNDRTISNSTVRTSLEKWTQSSSFKRLFRKLSKDPGTEPNKIVDHFVKHGGYPQSTERRSAEDIVRVFLKDLNDRLYNLPGGRARAVRRTEQLHADRKKEAGEAQEERGEIKSSVDSLSRPAREAVNIFLEESQKWSSPDKLLKEGKFSKAKEVFDRTVRRICELVNEHPEAELLLKNHRQSSLLKSARTATLLGLKEEALRNFEIAKAEGIDSARHRQIALRIFLDLGEAKKYEAVYESGEVEEDTEARIGLYLMREDWDELVSVLPSGASEFRHMYLRAAAEIEREKSSLSPTEIAGLLDDAEQLIPDANRVQKAQLAITTINLVESLVEGMQETPGLDRKALVQSARRRSEEVLEEYEVAELDGIFFAFLPRAVSFFQLLRDDREAEEIRQAAVDETSGSLSFEEERKEAFREGRISEAQYLYSKARDLLENPAGAQTAAALPFLQDAFEDANDNNLKTAVAEDLINTYLLDDAVESAENVLSQIHDLSEQRQILLEAKVKVYQGGEQAIQFLSDAAEEYPKHLHIRRTLARHLGSHIVELAEEGNQSDHISTLISKLEEQRRELQRILPTPHHDVVYARGLYAAGDYNPLIQSLNPVVREDNAPAMAMQLRAGALVKLERLDEAAEQFSDLSEEIDDWEYALNASYYWLQDGEAKKAISILEAWVDRHPEEPSLKMNLAAALMKVYPDVSEKGREAFNYLSSACDIRVLEETSLYMSMGKSASIAGKEEVARRYFQKAFSGPSYIVRSKEDAEEAMSSFGHAPFVELKLQGKEGIQAIANWNQKYSYNLNRLYQSELLSYGDLFRQSGGMMDTWTLWTEAARENYKSVPGQTAIKAPWPTVTRRLEAKHGLLLDITALLTAWKLGKFEALLRSAHSQGTTPHIRSDDLALLRQAVEDDVELMFDVYEPPYEDLIETLEEYDVLWEGDHGEVDQLREKVPEHLHEHLVNSTPDVGLTYKLEDAVYVSDQQESIVSDYGMIAEEVNVMTSAELLGAMAGSLIGDSEARDAAEDYDCFRGWKEVEADLPRHIVMSGFAIMDWYQSGLLTTFDNAWLEGDDEWPELHLGPFGSSHLRGERRKAQTKSQKEKETSTLYRELRELIEEGVVTVIPIGDPSPDNEEDLRVTQIATYGTKLIQVADQRGLNVWSDDRMIGYLLWDFGHPLPVPEIKQEFQRFRQLHPDVHLTTTEELLERFRNEGAIDSVEAEELGYELFKLGYRPLCFRLGLAHLLRNFAYRSGSPRYDPLLQAVKSVLEGVGSQRNAEGEALGVDQAPLQRLMLASMLPKLIISVWEFSGSRSVEERAALASDLVEIGVEQLDAHEEDLGQSRASFWVSILAGVARPENVDAESTSRPVSKVRQSIEWFVGMLMEHEAVPKQIEVVRQIEDYLIDFLLSQVVPFVEGRSDKEDWEVPWKEAAIADAVGAMWPWLIALLETPLLQFVDPVFRRVIDVLSQMEGEYKATLKSREYDLNVEEEEVERFAVELVEKALKGDGNAATTIRGDLAVECVWKRPVPDEEMAANPDLPESTKVYVNIPFLVLLLRKDVSEGLFELVRQELCLLDPSLQRDIEALRSEEDNVIFKSRSELALAILRSPFFELQRDLQHGIVRLRETDTDRLEDYLSPASSDEKRQTHPRVESRLEREFPSEMLSDFRVLYSMSHKVYDGAVREAEAIQQGITEEQLQLTLEQAASRFIELIKTRRSPLELASSFLAFFVMNEKVDGLRETYLEKYNISVQEWLGKSIKVVLDNSNENTSDVLGDRLACKTAHASAIRLGANIAGSASHLRAWQEELGSEEEVTIQWIFSSLILAARLTPLIAGEYENPEDNGSVLEETVRDLGVTYDEPLMVMDRFNPFLLGPHLLDHEAASMLYVLSIYIQHSEDPGSVLDLEIIREHAESWTSHEAGRAEEIYEEQKEKSSDVLGLKMPLLPSEAAKRLVEALDSME